MNPRGCTAGVISVSVNSSMHVSFSVLKRARGMIARVKDLRLRRALATNLSDLLRYQNMLCRYDTMALKSLDIFSIHGFPVGYVRSNPICSASGTVTAPGGVGGLGQHHRKIHKAKRYCTAPFEVAFKRARIKVVPIRGSGSARRTRSIRTRTSGNRYSLRFGDVAEVAAVESRRSVHRPAVLRHGPVWRTDAFLLCLASEAYG